MKNKIATICRQIPCQRLVPQGIVRSFFVVLPQPTAGQISHLGQ